jgi:SPP1 gp7 family putative phage head morphogenesis protein
MLRQEFSNDLKRRINAIARELREMVIDEDVFGLEPLERPAYLDRIATNKLTNNQRWRFLTTPQKVAAFQRWLENKFGQQVLTEQVENAYWKQYVEEGYKKGAGRAFDDTRKIGKVSKQKLDFYNGTKDEFLRSSFGLPEAIEKVKLLAGRVLTDLKGVTSALATKMSRTLTDGLVQGQNPRTIAKTLTLDLSVGANRADVIARTEIIRAHAEGQLDALQRLGVEQVGVAVEWSTAGDDRVCPLCRPLDGVVYPIAKAHGLIPRHPRCRCAFLPANVGESAADQLRSKPQVGGAMRRSIAAERSKRKKRTVAQQIKVSKWAGADQIKDVQVAKPLIQPGETLADAVLPADTLAYPKEITEGGTKEELAKLFALTKDRDRLNKLVKGGKATAEEIAEANRVKQALADHREAIRTRLGFTTKKITVKPVVPRPTPPPVTPPPIQPPPVKPVLELDLTPPAPTLPSSTLSIEEKIATDPELEAIRLRVVNAGSSESLVRSYKVKLGHAESNLNRQARFARQAQLQLDKGEITREQFEATTKAIEGHLETYRKQVDDLYLKLEEAKAQVDEDAAKYLFLPEEERMEFVVPKATTVYHTPASKNTQTKTKKALEFLTRVVKKTSTNARTYSQVVEMSKGARAFHRRGEGVYIAKDSQLRTFVHEFGHHLENDLPNAKRYANEFRRMRVARAGTKDIGMNRATGRTCYKDDEVGNEDSWKKAVGSDHAFYVGKRYSDGQTEIISMGIESLFANPARFAEKDPEYFKFIVGILRGKFGQPEILL